MKKISWDSLLYSKEEFNALYEATDGFNGEFNRNHRLREDGQSFASFMDQGCDALIQEHCELVKQLH